MKCACSLFQVFEAGCLKQFDSPQNLLQDNSGHFHEMITNMSETEQLALASMIENKEANKNFENDIHFENDSHNEQERSKNAEEQMMNSHQNGYSNLGFEDDKGDY